MADEEHLVISNFRSLLNQFKRPYIESTDAPDEETQTIDALNRVFNTLQTLYNIIYSVIQSNGNVPDSLRSDAEKMTIISVFDKEGILAALRGNNALKEPFLRYLKLDLLVYPYTLNTGHIDMLSQRHVESYQGELVNNKDEL